MLASPKPKTLRELIHFLHEQPELIAQNVKGRNKIYFKDFSNGAFQFDQNNYNFNLHSSEFREIGLTIEPKRFIVVCGDKSTTYHFGKSEA